MIIISSVQFSHSVVSSYFCDPWAAACQLSLLITKSQSLLKLMSAEWVIPPNNLILYHRLLLLPSIFPSIKVFSKESVLHIRWPKYWSFSINPPNEYSGLIFIGIDWSDLLAVQGTLESSPTPLFRSINSSVHSNLAIWSLVPLPFLKPAWTSGSSQLTYCWSLAWRILSITLLACEVSAIVW